jgi:hypothetical protein
VAERHERRVDPVLQRGPVVDEVESEAGSLALRPDVRGRQPDLRHEVPAGELGQDPGVDLVGLGGERGNAFDLGGVRDRNIPASELERVVDEARAGHGLDRSGHLLTSPQDVGGQRPECVDVRADGGHLDRLAALIEHVDVEPLA